MRLANETMRLTVGHETIVLRPSLRAAMRLNERHGGFYKLADAIAQENVTAMADVISECGGFDLLAWIDERNTSRPGNVINLDGSDASFGSVLHGLVAPLVRFVAALAGADDEAKPAKEGQGTSGKPMSFAEYHSALYRIGTGRLGWTPEITWNATPREIEEAYKGRSELLAELFRAVFGAPEGEEFDPSNVERDHAGFAALKAATAFGDNRG
jgi:hypothetical protein